MKYHKIKLYNYIESKKPSDYNFATTGKIYGAWRKRHGLTTSEVKNYITELEEEKKIVKRSRLYNDNRFYYYESTWDFVPELNDVQEILSL